MSGWRRLWIVLSLLFGIPVALITYDTHKRASAYLAFDGDSDKFWREARRIPSLSDCDWATVKTTNAYSSGQYITCDTKDPSTIAFWYGLIPGLLMGAIGLTGRWIYRGFRPAPVIRAHEDDEISLR